MCMRGGEKNAEGEGWVGCGGWRSDGRWKHGKRREKIGGSVERKMEEGGGRKLKMRNEIGSDSSLQYERNEVKQGYKGKINKEKNRCIWNVYNKYELIWIVMVKFSWKD